MDTAEQSDRLKIQDIDPESYLSITTDNLSDIDMSAFAAVQKMSLTSDKPPVRESSDITFFNNDLVWPDPMQRFEKTSGIKPALLTSELKHLNMDHRPKDRCEKALIVRKRPRPRELPWNVIIVKSDPPWLYDEDDLEEFLVHDKLFVEFFNAFLSLPSFPEPICFNVDTGGFEVVSDGKKRLAQQIKEAVRSQNMTAKMYRVARQHAFSEIPLVPIEDVGGPEQVKIETMYPVTTLNKEQGIHWVKAERLPIFLESDYYFEYRLAKVISQARLFNAAGEYLVMKIDYTSRPKKRTKVEQAPPPNEEELIVKDMFVSFGDMKGAAKEAWFTHAKEALKTEPTFTSLTPRLAVQTDTGPTAVKAKGKSSVFHSDYFGVYSPGLVGPSETEPPIQDEKSIAQRTFTKEKPFTPRPSERIHASTSMLRTKPSNDPNADEEMVAPGHVVFRWPKMETQQTDSESGFGEMDDREEKFEKRMQAQEIIGQIYNDGSWEEGGAGNIILKSVDELGSVIVGAVLKKTLAEMLDMDEKMILADPAISSIYPSKDLCCLSVDKLDLCLVVSKDSQDVSMTADESDEEVLNIPDKEPVHVKWRKKIPKPVEEESDADSLLDSDEDFEERDNHFRRNKDKWHSLTSMKGIMAFKKFLEGTQGEKFWNFWIDIDKGRLIQTEEQKQAYVLHMREKFYKKGAPYELSTEDKKKLALEKVYSWCPEYLLQVQAKVLEPLVLYWAPRYLLKHLVRSHPEKDYLYSQLMSALPPKESDPYPHTQALLPLGPKSCCPRSKPGPGFGELDTSIPTEDEWKTTPKVGNRRVYGEETLQRLALTPTAKYLNLKTDKSKPPRPKSQPKGKGGTGSRRSSVRTMDEFIDDIPQGEPHSVSSRQPNGTFIGLMKTSKTSKASLALSRGTTLSECSPKPSSVSTKKHVPCPSKPLAILDDKKIRPLTADGVSLGPVKKPRDLLSPMLRIVDTKEGRAKRIESAPVRKLKTEESPSHTFYRQDSQDSGTSTGRMPSAHAETTQGTGEYEIAEITDSDFLGSERMEFLLQALHHERDSGRSFRKYIEKSEVELWQNNIDFWERVQEYRKLFYKDKLDLHLIAKQARSLFAQFIVEGAPQSIKVSESVELSILNRLTPAYEDLFDEVEELAVKTLFGVFQSYLSQDVQSYCKVERAETMRRLETRNTYILNLQKKGIIKEGPITPDDPMEGYVEQVYDESIWERVPEEFRDWNLTKLSQNRLELEHFRNFLADNFADIDLRCWLDIEAWRRTPPDEPALRDMRAKELKKNYLNRKYFFGPSSPANAEGQNKVMQVGGGWGKYLDDKPHSNSILEAQKFVRSRIEKKHLPYFLLSEAFQERQQTKTSEADSLEDQFTIRKHRSLVVSKVLEEAEEAFYFFINKPLITTKAEDLVDKPGVLLPTITMKPGSQTSQPSITSLEETPPVTARSSGTMATPLLMTASLIDHQMDDTGEMLEPKLITTTKEIFMFSRAMMNPVTLSHFRKFISFRGDNLENNLLFWAEVQKYKQMHHNNSDEAMLQSKINAIINCFIDSSIPPSIQIDITQEMADRILDHKHEKGPYLFREAQAAIFGTLLPHWGPFREFRSNTGSFAKVMKTLDRHRFIAKKKEKAYFEEVARQREKERLERLARGEKEHGQDEEEHHEPLEEDLGEDRGEVVSFSYSDYLQEQMEIDKLSTVPSMAEEQELILQVTDQCSQTIRLKGHHSPDSGSRPGSRPGSSKSGKNGEKADNTFSDKENSLTRRSSVHTEKRRPSEVSAMGSTDKASSREGKKGGKLKEVKAK